MSILDRPARVSHLFPVVGIAVALVVVGCVMGPKVTTENLSSGAYRLTCDDSLPRCLEKVDSLCMGTRYEVVRAKDNRDYVGSAPAEREIRSSEAVVRCGSRSKTMGEAKQNKLEDAPPPASEAETAGAIVPLPSGGANPKTEGCTPGSTQECVGPGACRGGQACLPDGSAFGPCDCGGSPLPSKPSSDAGVPQR